MKKGNIMKQIFDFSGIENNEKSIKSTWQEFRNALANGEFLIDDIESAKKHTFLRVYDDLFNKNAGIVYNTITIRDISDYCLGRGTILGESEIPDYERFIPKKEVIKSDNRFSHKVLEDFNCLFCYCPLYHKENCPGNPQYVEKEGRMVKVCMNCTFPHQPENYDKVVQLLKKKV